MKLETGGDSLFSKPYWLVSISPSDDIKMLEIDKRIKIRHHKWFFFLYFIRWWFIFNQTAMKEPHWTCQRCLFLLNWLLFIFIFFKWTWSPQHFQSDQHHVASTGDQYSSVSLGSITWFLAFIFYPEVSRASSMNDDEQLLLHPRLILTQYNQTTIVLVLSLVLSATLGILAVESTEVHYYSTINTLFFNCWV